MNRRMALGWLGLGAAAPLVARTRRSAAQESAAEGTQDQGAAGLYDPFRVGRPQNRITDYENDPFIVGLESRIRCVCGCNLDVYTCRTTDFTCGTSPAMHREIVAQVEAGKTAQEILDGLIAEHGEMVLMAPKKEGFNLLAYFLPGAAVVTVGSILLWFLWKGRERAAAVRAAERVDLSGLSAEDRKRLESELANLES
jgi:cytochrome c-type biogenesis protein CcmH/NrfF